MERGGRAVLFFEGWTFVAGQVSVRRLVLSKEQFGINSQRSNFKITVFAFSYHLHEIIVNYYMNDNMNQPQTLNTVGMNHYNDYHHDS